MSAAMPLDRPPLYVSVFGLDFRDPIESSPPTVSNRGEWDEWLNLFRSNADIGSRCGLIHHGLEHTKREDKARAFAWYLKLANGHQSHTNRYLESPWNDFPETTKMRNLAFQMICKAFAVRPGGPEHDSICVRYLDSEETISTFMWFIQSRACGNFNVRNLSDHKNDAFKGFLRSFVRMHWSEVRFDRHCENNPQDIKLFASWLVANRPYLLRYLYHHQQIGLIQHMIDGLTPDDVAVLRDCLFRERLNIDGKHRFPKTLQEVRDYGNKDAWDAVRVITKADVLHRTARSSKKHSARK